MRPRRFGWGWLLGIPISVGFGSLVFLCSLAIQEGPRLLAPPPAPHANWAADFPTRIDAVTAALAQLPWPLPAPKEEPQGSAALKWTHRRYDLTLPAPAKPDTIDAALEPVRRAAPGVVVNVTEDASGAHVHLGIDGLLTHTLSLHWLGRRPRVALIIDDLGNDLLIARELSDIDTPLTFAVMPFRPFSAQVAERAALAGREVLLHLPMEAESGETFGAQEILRVRASRDDVLRMLDESLAAVPHAVGVNNHMGSRFSSDRDRMRWVLERLKEKGLFFVDSRTSPKSVACAVAVAVAVRCAPRSVFIDDTDDEAAIREQIETLGQTARTRGDVIAIGHARPATLAALRAALPGLAAAGVDVVPVSTIMADVSLSRR